jgi:hypothetical protein
MSILSRDPGVETFCAALSALPNETYISLIRTISARKDWTGHAADYVQFRIPNPELPIIPLDCGKCRQRVKIAPACL